MSATATVPTSAPAPVAAGVLGKEEILKRLESGEVCITPADKLLVGPASIDLTLGDEFRFFNTAPAVIDIKEETDYKEFTEKVVVPPGGFYTLLPGQACLAITRETVKLPHTLCGLLEGRSRFARLGLFVHITASFINPGINNRQVLEIFNSSNHALALYPGTRICQLVLMHVQGAPAYSGQFNTQTSL